MEPADTTKATPMGRNRKITPHADWRVVRNGLGQLIILDQDGFEPLKHPDRVERVCAIYIASRALDFKYTMLELQRVLEMNMSGYHHYRWLMECATLTLSRSIPPLDLIKDVEGQRDQGELDLEAA